MLDIFSKIKSNNNDSCSGGDGYPLALKKNTGFLVYYHNDFDGILTAALFSLRIEKSFGIPKKYFIYYPIEYGWYDNNSVSFPSICAEAKKKLNVNDVYLIFLDFDPSNEADLFYDIEALKNSFFLSIDHHAFPNKFSKITIHNRNAYSCAELLNNAMPIPDEREEPKNISKAIEASKIIDSGGIGVSWEKFLEAITTIPGCLVIFNINNKLSSEQTFTILRRFLTGDLTTDDENILNQLIETNAKIFSYVPKTEKEFVIAGGKKVGIYLFGLGRIDYLYAIISSFKAFFSSNPDDLAFIIRQVNEDTYRVSVRTTIAKFNIDSFCKLYGGGGRGKYIGGFSINLRGWSLDNYINRLVREAETELLQLKE